MSLLDVAKEADRAKGRPRRAHSREELELLIAFARGEISARACGVAMKVSQSNVYARLSALLRQFVSAGDVDIVERKAVQP